MNRRIIEVARLFDTAGKPYPLRHVKHGCRTVVILVILSDRKPVSFIYVQYSYMRTCSTL